jgi:hypothetical protein
MGGGRHDHHGQKVAMPPVHIPDSIFILGMVAFAFAGLFAIYYTSRPE